MAFTSSELPVISPRGARRGVGGKGVEAAKLVSSNMAFSRSAARVTRGMLGRGTRRLVQDKEMTVKLCGLQSAMKTFQRFIAQTLRNDDGISKEKKRILEEGAKALLVGLIDCLHSNRGEPHI